MENNNWVFDPGRKKQSVELGLVAMLVSLFLALGSNGRGYTILAIVLGLLSLILPIVLYPFARAWHWLSGKLALVSSTLLLTLVFFTVLVPVGLFRRLMGKDRMQRKQFKRSTASVFVVRDHPYSGEDFLNIF